MAINTAKHTARMLVGLLERHGVREAIVSPGSRNAPLLVALERSEQIHTRVVIDERSAAFVALGLSAASGGSPVAICCTSGTAPLNYAPALAEAFYRELPLIAVTADRPEEWIDQDDSQTIRQPGIYDNFIKYTVDLQCESPDHDRMWMTNRLINQALLAAIGGRPGPVHINVRLADPLGAMEEVDEVDPIADSCRLITAAHTNSEIIVDEDFDELLSELSPQNKVLILAGFMLPENLDAYLRELSRRPNIVIMHEAQSNLHGHGDFIANIDATLSRASAEERQVYAPDIVITLGGALLSRHVKAWLRSLTSLSHWAIGEPHMARDPFRRLSRVISGRRGEIIRAVAANLRRRNDSEPTAFKSFWTETSRIALADAISYAESTPWSDFKAMYTVMKHLPRKCALHLSNGTAVRYAQLFDYSNCARVDSNRGVSGIDGCTSTAIGASFISSAPTILISGDMCFAYDIGALALRDIPPSMKMIVLNNSGGGIFRFIPSTNSLPELQKYFVAPPKLPLAKLAQAYGFKYLEAHDVASLEKAMKKICSITTLPVILEIFTPGELSADILRNFFENQNTH